MRKTNVITSNKDKTMDQILVAALIAAVKPGRQSYQYSELLSTTLSPTKYLTNKILLMLGDSSVIQIVERPWAESSLVLFRFPNEDELLKQLIEKLKSCATDNVDKLENLAQEIMAAESLQFIAFVASPYGISTDIDFQPHALLVEMLFCRPMCEVHMLLWQSVKRLMEQDGRILIATNDAETFFEQVIKDAHKLHEGYKKENSYPKSFVRPGKFRRSAIASVIFQYVLGCGNSYYDSMDIFVNADEKVIIENRPPF